MAIDFPVPLVGFAAFSGTGKTTLLAQLLPLLKARGLRIAVVKHAHHSFDPDHPGKDSHTLRKAGADRMLVASRNRMALIVEQPDKADDVHLADALAMLDPRGLDLVLVEGFKHESYPKIELHRRAVGKPLLYPDDPSIIAVAMDDKPPDAPEPTVPRLALDDLEGIAKFVVGLVDQARPST